MAIDKTKIRDWFEEECETAPEEQHHEELDWLFLGVVGQLPIAILYPQGAGYIQIQRQITVGKEHLQALKNKTITERDELLHQIKRGLMLIGARYQMDFSDEESDLLTHLRLNERIYEDALIRDTFHQRIFTIHNASIFFINELRHFLEA